MIGKLRKAYREITTHPAGERFCRYHHNRKRPAARIWHRVVRIGAGLLLLALGLLLSLPPLLPGFLLWLPGLALLASQSLVVARSLDRSECLVRKLYRRIARRI